MINRGWAAGERQGRLKITRYARVKLRSGQGPIWTRISTHPAVQPLVSQLNLLRWSSLLRVASILMAAGLFSCVGSPSNTSGSGGSDTPGSEMPLLESLPTQRIARENVALDPANWELPDPAADAGLSSWFRLFYSQDNRAELEACGCPGSPTGGMARRVEYVRRLRELVPDLLLVEGPSALSRSILGFENINGRDRARADMVLRSIGLTEPAAFFPGQADFAALPPKTLGRRAAALGIPLVATNLSKEAGGGYYQRFFRWEGGGKSVLLLGLVGAAGTQERSDLARRDDAVRAASDVIAAVTQSDGKPDLVIAFTDGDARDIRGWEHSGLPVDVLLTPPVVGDSGEQHWESPWLTQRADPLGRAFRRLDILFGERRAAEREKGVSMALGRVATTEQQYLQELWRYRGLERRAASGDDPRRYSVGMDGKRRSDPGSDPVAVRRGLAELKALRRRAIDGLAVNPTHRLAVSTWVIEPAVPEDEKVVEMLDSFGERRLARLALERGDVTQVPRDERFAGRGSCTECHAGLDAHWTRTPHALAWKSLVDRGEEHNPDCLPCHSTGFAEPGGFVDPDADRSLLNVQCEACHGPMLVHSQQPERSRVRREPGLRVMEATCRRCHDQANSPRFDFKTYLRRVTHP